MYLQYDSDNLPYEKVGKSEPVCIADEVPFDIPESWEWAKIETISMSIGNKNNQIQSKEVLPAGKIPVVSQGKELIDGYCNDVSKKIDVLPLVMFGDHTRNVKYIDFEFVIGADGTKFHKILSCNSKYIYYWMLYTAETLRNRGYARHYTLLKECFIPLPPLQEQVRIVSKIKAILPLVEKYGCEESKRVSLDSAFPNLLKKSILQEAIQGKLVPQNPVDEPASVLLERIRAEKEQLIKAGKIKRDKHESVIFRRDNSHYEKCGFKEENIDDLIPFELPDSWEWIRLSTILTSTDAGKSPQCENRPRTIGEWGVIKTTAIQDGYFLAEENKVLPPNFNLQESMVVHHEDLLITRAGPRNRTGVICVVDGEPENLILSDKTVRLSYLRNFVNPHYVMTALSSPAMQYFVVDAMTGMAASQVNISQEKMKTFFLPLPPLNEQQRIVDEVSKIFGRIDKLNF